MLDIFKMDILKNERMSIFIYLYIHGPSVYLSIYPHVICLSIYLHIYHLFILQSLYTRMRDSLKIIYLRIYLFISSFFLLFIYLQLSIDVQKKMFILCKKIMAFWHYRQSLLLENKCIFDENISYMNYWCDGYKYKNWIFMTLIFLMYFIQKTKTYIKTKMILKKRGEKKK